jgi:nucleotide-binding universal stress UspA family protein
MFKHILIPTDGSPNAEKAVDAGIALAKALGAKVTCYYAIDPIPHRLYAEGVPPEDAAMAQVELRAREIGEQHVAVAAKAARAAGVLFDSLVDKARPYEGILGAAQKHNCDVIVMTSQGRTGLKAIILGSVANQVLTHSTIPVVIVPLKAKS